MSERAVWNIAFLDGKEVVWPMAPALPGITLLVARQGLERLGRPVRMEPIHVSRVGSFRAAATRFITAGQAIAESDGVRYEREPSDALVRVLHRAHGAVPMERI